MTELLDTTTLSTRQPEGEKASNSGDTQSPAGRVIGLPRLTAIARERYGEVITYHKLWSACVAGILPAWRVGALWVVDEQEALEALPRLFKRPAAAPDAA